MNLPVLRNRNLTAGPACRILFIGSTLITGLLESLA
jgi:hypothetical protein